MQLQQIDWNENVYNVVGDVSVDLDHHSTLSRSELIKEIVASFEGNTPFEYYVYCFEYEDGWYVGETSNLRQRITTHCSDKNVVNIERVEGAASRDEALERERELSYEMAIEKDSTEIYGGR